FQCRRPSPRPRHTRCCPMSDADKGEAMMDLREITEYRIPIGVGLVLLILVSGYANGYRLRSEHLKTLEARSASLARDRDQVLADIARAPAEVKATKMLPARAVVAPSPGMSAVERHNCLPA